MASTPSQNCTIENPSTGNAYITNITQNCQEDIFNLSPKDSDKPNILQKHLSVLRTDTQYATNKNLPPGSATIVDLNYYRENFAYPKDRVKLGTDKDDKGNGLDVYTFNKEILFVIQAAPAGFGAANISNQSVTNSVYNCLYLANANGVKGIAFPIIGGSIFFNALKITKNQLYEILLQGVADYFNDFRDSKIEIVLFAHGSKVDDTDDFKTIFTTFVSNNKIVEDKLTELEGMLFTAEYQYNNIDNNTTKITALVNAANTEVQFGTGISGAFSQKLGRATTTKESGVDDKIFTISDDINSQGKEIKKAFKAAVDAYIANPTAPPPSPSPPEPAPEKPKVAFADVFNNLVGQLNDKGDTSVDYKNLGVTDNFLYPTDGDASVVKKNLNCATPSIDDMIKGFESAETGDDKNFYLGACQSIQAAYDLEMSGITDGDITDDEAKIRAKLLLNLRKNSLLLKVPARWNYAKMELGEKVEEPVLTPPFSVPLENEAGVFCFENVGFQLLFSIDSVRKFSEKKLEEIDATNLCNSLSIESDRPKCNDVIVNTYDVLHKMSEQYKQDKLVAVEAKKSKQKLEQIKNIEVTEVYTQEDGSKQADAADFLIMTILQYLKLYKPIYNSIYFTQYELTLCSNDIDNNDLSSYHMFKYETDKYVDDAKKEYNFSKNSVLNDIGVDVNNKKLLDILNPVGYNQTQLMCFTNGNSIQECIDDYLSEKNLEINNDENSATYKLQEYLKNTSKCEKENTKKRSVLYIPETQKYLIVTLKRYTLNAGKTSIINKNINVSENIIINNNIEYAKKYEFKLRGVICKTGSENGGHYVYISYENEKKILYNDSALPTDFKGEYNINTTGYVFLYEKNTSVQAGGRNIIHTTTHSTTTPKSRHNSSFKASSSSKSKGKSHSRSHTQRVK
jgi:O-acetyl-ADP-ribose deacetylase (regulator of RNase III)